MATVVGIMDRSGWNANTDNLVVVDPARRRVLWIPRDLWSDRVDDRISRAFASRGHEGLAGALEEHGVHVRHSVCLKREAVERALRDVIVSVPVVEQMRFWYPLNPTRPLEEGRKLVCFDPPAETLAGERIHQWVGARRRVGRASSDFERIERQQVFLARLLERGFPSARALRGPASRSCGHPTSWSVLDRRHRELVGSDDKATSAPSSGRPP